MNVRAIAMSLKTSGMTNLVANGTFENTDSWTAVASTLSAAGNILNIKASGASSQGNANQDTATDVVLDHMFYIRGFLRALNADCTSIRFRYDGSTAGSEATVKAQASPQANLWYELGGVALLPANATGKLRLCVQQAYADAATAADKEMEAKEIALYDLYAEFGEGLEPTGDGMNAMFSPVWKARYFKAA